MIVHGFILLLLLSIVPINSLICNDCYCGENNITACDCGNTTTEFNDIDYCVISEQKDTLGTYITLTRIARNSTFLYVEDPYFLLTVESIRYNRTINNWYLFTDSILFGCDWDYCNSPNLIQSLPDSFKLSIDENWLNTNIYGNGSVNSCHHCPLGVCADNERPFNSSGCPLTPCLNATSCSAFDLWFDVDTGHQCVFSECAPSYLNGEFADYYGGKYRLDIETIVYLSQNRSAFDIWEIDLYCSAYNCTRPTIFQEISQQLMADISDLSVFPLTRPITTTTIPPPTTTTPIANPITCYSCDCLGTTACPCDATEVVSLTDNYCIIIRELFGQSVYISLNYAGIYETDMYVREFPYVLTKESIGYDESSGLWYTTTNYVMYGCNWNLCNKPDLVPLLPNSFHMRLPEVWLNSSVLGSGLPVRDCHECPAEAECGLTDYLDANVCPIQPCNTTCLVIDTYDDPTHDYLCYNSYCLPPDTEFLQLERHRVEIEGIVYASQPKVVELWEIDIYCRADNCSRPGIFRELHQQLTIQVGTLNALFNETYDPIIPQRRCYDCYCSNPFNCSCDRTTLAEANSTYCLINRQNYGQTVWIDFGHIDQGSARSYIRDFPYLLVEESILYSEQTGQWNTITNYVTYGCNWDYCNHPNLVQYMPTSFQMRLPEVWLNSSVLGSGQPVRNCHECPDAPICTTNDTIDGNLCPVKECNTTCIVFDVYDDPAHNLQCYQSFCVPPDSDSYQADRHRVEIEGILYLSKEPRSIELWEVDIYCRADDCSRPNIFNEIKTELIVDYGDLSAFELLITLATHTTSTQSTTTQSTTTQSILPPNASIVIGLNLFILPLILILLFNFY